MAQSLELLNTIPNDYSAGDVLYGVECNRKARLTPIIMLAIRYSALLQQIDDDTTPQELLCNACEEMAKLAKNEIIVKFEGHLSDIVASIVDAQSFHENLQDAICFLKDDFFSFRLEVLLDKQPVTVTGHEVTYHPFRYRESQQSRRFDKEIETMKRCFLTREKNKLKQFFHIVGRPGSGKTGLAYVLESDANDCLLLHHSEQSIYEEIERTTCKTIVIDAFCQPISVNLESALEQHIKAGGCLVVIAGNYVPLLPDYQPQLMEITNCGLIDAGW